VGLASFLRALGLEVEDFISNSPLRARMRGDLEGECVLLEGRIKGF